ncbi:MAG: 5-formyltetrahydrofolate cyclo-ligase [Cryobacterium sp.]|nr:5-formyltetrahydrofolate cyclo-ligase [Cryobacterium sp.]MBX3090017.1 5-formyltetrahydrofolate cyclo-ligase [Cryobacterium sp.]MCO5293393.1 5-formyltetrahydrofolate cyclo-ligase [Homoserinimonas sp.]MCW5945011.1 5-formyltetrahydrofolate cyclo-ligase [Cryobacterium sp.]
MSGDESLQKRALRAELRRRRHNLTSSERENATAGFTENLVNLASDLRVTSLAAYLPAQDEPNIRPFLDWAEDQNIRVLLPVSRDDGLLDWAVSTDGEQQGLHGMPEPVGELLGPIAINDVDLIIAPAAAVDKTGMRMGWGRGYFDRTLGSMERCPPVYAVVFDNELVESVPTELHDKKVNGVVTPSAITALPLTN